MRSGAAVALLTVLASSFGCSALPVFGYPPEALRKSPPPGVDLPAVCATVPPVELQTTGGAINTAGKRVLLVFYRGHW